MVYEKPKKKELGALWVKEGQNGKKFLSGVLSLEGRDGPKIQIVCFKNDYATEAKHPQYKIFESTPREKTAGEDQDQEPF